MLNTPEETPGPEDQRLRRRARRGARSGDRAAAAGPADRVRHAASQGLKLGEIAEALGLAEGTVKRQLHAAVHRLRACADAPPTSRREDGHDAPAHRAGHRRHRALLLRRARRRRARRDVERHLPSCAECRQALDDLHDDPRGARDASRWSAPPRRRLDRASWRGSTRRSTSRPHQRSTVVALPLGRPPRRHGSAGVATYLAMAALLTLVDVERGLPGGRAVSAGVGATRRATRSRRGRPERCRAGERRARARRRRHAPIAGVCRAQRAALRALEAGRARPREQGSRTRRRPTDWAYERQLASSAAERHAALPAGGRGARAEVAGGRDGATSSWCCCRRRWRSEPKPRRLEQIQRLIRKRDS